MNDVVQWLETGGLLSWMTGGGWDYALPPEAAQRFDQAVGDLRTPEHIVFRIRQEKLFPHDDEEMADELKKLFANGSYFAAYRTAEKKPLRPPSPTVLQTPPKPSIAQQTAAPVASPGSVNPSPETTSRAWQKWLVGFLMVVMAIALLVYLRRKTI